MASCKRPSARHPPNTSQPGREARSSRPWRRRRAAWSARAGCSSARCSSWTRCILGMWRCLARGAVIRCGRRGSNSGRAARTGSTTVCDTSCASGAVGAWNGSHRKKTWPGKCQLRLRCIQRRVSRSTITLPWRQRGAIAVMRSANRPRGPIALNLIRPVTGNEIRTRFLEHFASREHLVLPSAPLVPHGDPSTLFISAGMQPLKPYYLGLGQPPAPRLATCQKCLRTGDIDEVGKTDRHHTFFEMLGTFAPTGDYFKETAIPLAWELVTKSFQMPVDRLRITIHPTDDQAHEIWLQQPGMTADHMTRLEDNWWGLGEGPCGPDSEIWWDRGREVGCGQEDCVPDHCDRFTEFWNLVFPHYDQRGPIAGPSGEAGRRGVTDGSLTPLQRPAIDTGMGLERISYILQGKDNIIESELFQPLCAGVTNRT